MSKNVLSRYLDPEVLSHVADRHLAPKGLVIGNLALILSNRSATEPFWVTLRTPNRALWVVVGLALALLLAALYVPWAVEVLRFAPLPWHELAAAGGLGLLSVFWFEAIKRVRRGRRAQR